MQLQIIMFISNSEFCEKFVNVKKVNCRTMWKETLTTVSVEISFSLFLLPSGTYCRWISWTVPMIQLKKVKTSRQVVWVYQEEMVSVGIGDPSVLQVRSTEWLSKQTKDAQDKICLRKYRGILNSGSCSGKKQSKLRAQKTASNQSIQT